MSSEPIQKLLCIGPSLWPLVRSGSEVEVMRVSVDSLRPGDLVVYCGPHIQVCHRILSTKIDDGIRWFLMKGDSKQDCDGWVPSYRIVGKVVRVNACLISSPVFRFLSTLLFWHSKIQYALFEMLFQHSAGRLAAECRSRFFSKPVFAEFFAVLSNPWSFLNPSRSRK